MEYARWILAGLVAIALFLSSWIVIPAPTMALLPLGVGAPEISPILLLSHVILLLLWYLLSLRLTGTETFLLASLDTLGWLILSCSALGVILSSLPLLQLPATLHRAERAMVQGLGPQYVEYLEDSPSAQSAGMRLARPFNLIKLIRGIAIPTIAPEQHSIATPDGATLTVDVYSPRPPSRPSTPQPILVTIYGGAWQSGNPQQKSKFNAYMAAQGYAVVALEYRHAPDYQFPTQINDVNTVLRWIGTHAPDYGWNRDRLALVGWSAGGHLALLAAYAPLLGEAEREASVTIQSVVNYYGPVDLAKGYADLPVPDPIDNRAVLETFLGGSPDQVPTAYQAASPITYVEPGLPPTLLVYGDHDHLVKPGFGQQLHRQLRSQGNQSVLIRLPWAEHAFDALFSGMGNQVALYHTERFLAWTLRSPSP